MRRLEGQPDELYDPATWMPLVWSLVVVSGAAFAAALALPTLPGYANSPSTARAIFHPEWLVVSTLLVFPLYRAARSSWRAALLAVPVACAHAVYVAVTAVDALHKAGLTSGLFAGWYAVAFAQVALFVTVGVVGARRDVIDRKWVRTMRRVAALPAPDRAHRNAPAQPAGHHEPPHRPESGLAA